MTSETLNPYENVNIIDFLVKTKLAITGSEARRLIMGGAVQIDSLLVSDTDTVLIPANVTEVRCGRQRALQDDRFSFVVTRD